MFVGMFLFSCSKNNAKKAMENCADGMFVDSFSSDQALMVLNQNFIKIYPYYNKIRKMSEEILDMDTKRGKINIKIKKIDDEIEQRVREAKKANVPQSEINKFREKMFEKTVPLSQEAFALYWDRKRKTQEQNDYLFINRKKIIKKAKIEDKFNLKNYSKMHEYCEILYNKAPDTFLIEFKNSKL